MTARMINSQSPLKLHRTSSWSGISSYSSWMPTNGPDRIHPRILEELADVITKPLSITFEQSWEYGEVPVDRRMANVVLFSKKGKKENPGNYRPVRLTSVPGKVMEKVILESIEKHLKDNTITGHSQHVLMRGKS
ncbi:rna-directed dna polymerase from mobile element jockey-like [Willisornis vidua]|uniref:Rna-directed dna polymerase from mobile element jockey-like n=1 Tax=Willisornis vidua TaxID=1566151 RepID=A0ABQ9CQC3_9PASS|nr:rna-directed dna polymerase from mobile element jockey-like [Willisornis vidua]